MKEQNHRGLIITEFILYIFIIIFVIFFKSITPNYYKWVITHYRDTMFVYPTISERFLAGLNLDILSDKTYNIAQMLTNGLMNIVSFVPFGALLYHLSSKAKLFRAVMISLAFSSLVEIVQLITVIGGFGIKDIIANVFGGFLGACIMALISKVRLGNKITRTILIALIFTTAIALTYFMRNAFMHFDAYINILTRNI